MNLLESLQKTFFRDVPIKNTSVTSPEDNTTKILTPGMEELEFPTDHFSSYNRNKKTREKQTALQLKNKYIKTCRAISLYPEVANVIDEHINEMINTDLNGTIVKLDFDDNDDIGEKTEKVLLDAFSYTQKLLDLNNNIDQLIKDWYIDGVLPIEVLYNEKDNKQGVKGLIQLDPLTIKQVSIISTNKIYYTTDDNIQDGAVIQDLNQLKNYFDKEQFIEVNSGLLDETKSYYLSYLKLAIKPANNLQQIEDAMVIYRILKSAEKNVWNVDVGTMPKTKAENYINQVKQSIMSDFNYDSTTGELSGTSAVRSIMEDWIFPSRNGNTKTSVETLGGNSSFTDNLDDLEYFRKKLYQALKYPVSRIDDTSTLDFSADDILRDELKYLSFINKLRRMFNNLFIEIMKRHIVSKGDMSELDFNNIKQSLNFIWSNNNQIVEKAKINNFKDRAEAMDELKSSEVIGSYISRKYAMNNILGMTDEEYEVEKEQIAKELKEFGTEEEEE